MPSNHLIFCRPLFLLPSIFPSIRVFSNESALLIRWPKYWSSSFNISPCSGHPGLVFRMDWLDLLAVQGTLKNLLQHHSSKASILRRSKPGLENFEHYFTTVWDECNCAVVWAFFVIALFGIGMKTDLFQSYGYCWVFQICWPIECSTLTTSPFRIWNSSTGNPSPPLALYVVMLPKAHLTLHSRMSGSWWGLHHRGYLGYEDLFCVVLCILASSC